MTANVIAGQALNLDLLSQYSRQPPLFEPGEALFWDDPHISKGMLAAHLDPNVDAASRRPEVIARTVDWLIRFLDLKVGDSVLDLGCGPGLYCERLARRGLRVTGVDASRRSIEYARQSASDQGLAIEYRYQDYLTLADSERFDGALLIYGDLCPLPSQARDALLCRVRRALRPGGWFVCDVTTPEFHHRAGLRNAWYVAQSGFWKPGPHLVLEQGWEYPGDVYLEQYLVVEQSGNVSVYRNWFQDYSLNTLTDVLKAQGFSVEAAWSDLTGVPYRAGGDWIGIAARKA